MEQIRNRRGGLTDLTWQLTDGEAILVECGKHVHLVVIHCEWNKTTIHVDDLHIGAGKVYGVARTLDELIIFLLSELVNIIFAG